MKIRLIALVCAMFIAVGLFGCTQSVAEEPNTLLSASIDPETAVRDVSYVANVVAAVTLSDIVVDATVTTVLGDGYYQADINQEFKAGKTGAITFYQEGEYPSFVKGDRLVLFLGAADSSIHPDAYQIVGSDALVADVLTLNDMEYVVFRNGALALEFMVSQDLNVDAEHSTEALSDQVLQLLPLLDGYDIYIAPHEVMKMLVGFSLGLAQSGATAAFETLHGHYNLGDQPFPDWYGGCSITDDNLLSILIVEGYEDIRAEIAVLFDASAPVVFDTAAVSLEYLYNLQEHLHPLMAELGLNSLGVSVTQNAVIAGMESVDDWVVEQLAEISPHIVVEQQGPFELH